MVEYASLPRRTRTPTYPLTQKTRCKTKSTNTNSTGSEPARNRCQRASAVKIALVIESNREYGREVLKGIAQFACERKNWQLRLIPQLGLGEKNALKGFDGIIARVTNGETLRRLKNRRIPLVDLFLQGDPDCPIGVGCDNRRIAEMAAKYFLRHGFRRFAFCGYKGTRYSDERFSAFRKVLGDSGFSCEEYPAIEKPGNIILQGDRTMRPRNMRRFAAWVARLPPQTAVFCANDIRAYHVLRVCNDIGRDVPDDIAIMGVDNDIVLCSCASVAISSIDPNAFGAGYAAARLLDAAIADPAVLRKRHSVFRVKPTGLIERKSTTVFPVNLPWMAGLLSYIDDNTSKPITARDLESIACVSHSALHKAFRKAFGISAGRYILAEKMRKAKQLVDDGSLLVKEIADQVGFADPKYFCRVYRAYFGHPPSKHR